MGYAFISYKTENKDKADALRNLFKNNNIKCWMAPESIEAGKSHPAAINQAIKNCSCFVLVLTELVQTSPDITAEIKLAIRYRKYIIPIQIEKSLELNDEFDYLLINYQIKCVESIDENDSEMANMLKEVINYTGITEITEAVKAEPVKKENNLLSMTEKYGAIDVDKNGYRYEGKLKNGKYHGKGTLYRPDGSKLYEGDWVNGKKNGKFNVFNNDGSLRYEAEFDDDTATVVDEDGYKYVGQMKDGKRHGKGIEYRPDGTKLYEGNWVDGKRHGKGTSYCSDGSKIYDGDWVNGLKHGKGAFYCSDGSMFIECDWINGIPHGKGIEYHYDGSIVYKGEFENGFPKDLLK